MIFFLYKINKPDGVISILFLPKFNDLHDVLPFVDRVSVKDCMNVSSEALFAKLQI